MAPYQILSSKTFNPKAQQFLVRRTVNVKMRWRGRPLAEAPHISVPFGVSWAVRGLGHTRYHQGLNGSGFRVAIRGTIKSRITALGQGFKFRVRTSLLVSLTIDYSGRDYILLYRVAVTLKHLVDGPDLCLVPAECDVDVRSCWRSLASLRNTSGPWKGPQSLDSLRFITITV